MKKWFKVMLLAVVLSVGLTGCEPEEIQKIGQKVEQVAIDAEYQLTDPESDVQRTTGEVVGIAQTTGAVVRNVPWIPYREVILAITSVIELLGLVILGWRKKQTTKTLKAVVNAIGDHEKDEIVVKEWDEEKQKDVEKATTVGEVIKPAVADHLQSGGINRQGKALIEDAKNY